MTIKWTEFPAAVTATAGDVVVGLAGGTANAQFNANSWLFKANNFSDVANKTTSFNNVSPLTTNGDTIIYNSANVRLAIGANTTVYSVVAGLPAWITVSTLLTNLGLAAASNVTFASLTTTGVNVASAANALTAHSGGGQGSALALTKAINRITTVAAGGDSVKLPSAVAGTEVTVINAAAANAMDCFPASGEVINALSANTALSIIANKTVSFFCAVSGIWNSLVTA